MYFALLAANEAQKEGKLKKVLCALKTLSGMEWRMSTANPSYQALCPQENLRSPATVAAIKAAHATDLCVLRTRVDDKDRSGQWREHTLTAETRQAAYKRTNTQVASATIWKLISAHQVLTMLLQQYSGG